MFSKRVFISLIASAIIMLSISYLWHGVVLNDFNLHGYPAGYYFLFKAGVYLIIGLIMSKAIELKILDKEYKHRPVAKGVVVGLICGFAFFLVLTIKSIGSPVSIPFSHHLLNLAWQLLEQMIGGIVVGFCSIFFYDSDSVED